MGASSQPQIHALASAEAAAAWLRARLEPGAALTSDSRALRPGDAFFGWPGAVHDGRAHAAAALAAGAVACVLEAEGLLDGAARLGVGAALAAGDARIAAVHGLKALAGPIAAELHGHPGTKLAMLAVTGTNGKTSTACWLAQALDALGRPCGVVGTLGVGRVDTLDATGLTTPDALSLQATLAGFVQQGLAACAMEASSIGLVEHRMAGTPVDVALFTNLTQDHLDYHGSMAAYWSAKRRLFAWPGLKAAVVNLDDGHGAALADELTSEGRLDLWTVSLANPMARLVAGPLRYADGGFVIPVREGRQTAELRTTLVGAFNASNLLGVLAGLRALGHALADAARAAERVTAVPGRLQRVPGSGAALEVFVDYAHTPDALEQTLTALRPLAAARGGRLGCLFGCGGNRDATKRPTMGAIAARLADAVVLTSDNPRLEDPAAILAQIEAGIERREHVLTIEDRAEAIAHAIANAKPGDVWLLAGKGHEDYQDLGGTKRPFLDLAHASAALAARGLGA
jgi:UDP-N-acetylmuramoyl-L-alanyl-D-glutamate--2,6-diaminopimelate ligase